jgi:hypothetical protein
MVAFALAASGEDDFLLVANLTAGRRGDESSALCVRRTGSNAPAFDLEAKRLS